MNRLSKTFSRALSSFKPSSASASTAAAAAARPRASPPVTTAAAAARPTAAMSTAAKTVSSTAFFDNVKNRRTHYVLSKDLPISKDRIQEIVKDAVLHVPTSFNSQTTRVAVLFGAEHEKLWDITTEVLKAIVPAAEFEPTAQKMAMFKGAAGSVLFFEDDEAIHALQAKFPLYADKFPLFATQSDGMTQHVIWTALSAEGLGANLQHYSPLIDERVAAEWKIPSSWKLNAQLVFGGRTGEAGPKEFQPIEERYKVFGA